jgi:CHAT domain-containing protein
MTRAMLGVVLVMYSLGCGDDGVPESATSDASGEAFDSLFASAEDVYFSGAFDSARVLLTGIRERARQEGAASAEARALTWVGLVAFRLSEYDEAIDVGQEALELKLRNGLDDQLARSYNALGLVAWMQNRLTESLQWYEKADSVASALGDERMVFTVASNIASSMIELGQFAEARRRLFDAREFMAETDDARLEGNALINLGMLEIRLGNPLGGLESLREAIRRHQEIDYQTGVTNALGHVGAAYVMLGQPSTALATLDSALVLADTQGLRSEEASLYEIMADVYRDAGDFHRAIDLYDRAQVINAELGLDWETGIDLRGEADIHLRLSAYPRARDLATEALTIHRRVGAPLEEMRDLLLLAEVSDLLDDSAAVTRFLSHAGQVADELGAPIARVEVALATGRIHDRHRRSREALEELNRVSDDLPRGGYAAEWEASLLRSRAHLRLGELESAAIAGRRAVETVERVRVQFGSAALRTAFGADKREVYAHLVSVLLRRGEVDEAFEVADGARGRALLEHSAVGGSNQSRESALDEGEVLLREIDAIEERIAFFEDFAPADRSLAERNELDGLYRSLPQVRSRYELLLVQTAEADPAMAAFLGRRRTDADVVRRSLRPGQLILSYFVPNEGAVVLFMVSERDVHVLETPITVENLSSRVRLARELIGRHASDERLPRVLRGLYAALVRPALAVGLAADVDELLIVPHDVLSYLPFAALLDETTGRYLVEDYTVRVVPSAAALPLLRGRPSTAPAAAGASAFAPFPAELSASRNEAGAVAARLDARRYEGRRATESALRVALTESRIVHVATHGVMNRFNPVFSRLELATGSGKSADDGRLEVHELLGLSVNSELVFLSGCETGLGIAGSSVFAPGEDYATLSQAFLFAGARNVVATLWPVEDRASAELASRFYEALAQHDAAAALAEAQRAMLTQDGLRAPYYWAAHQVAGINGAMN